MSTEVQQMNGVYDLGRYIKIRAINCDVRIEGGDPYSGSTKNMKVVVSDIKSSGMSMLFFMTEPQYPLAEQNWFHFRNGVKNIYFDNKVRLNATGSGDVTQSFIQFTEEPNSTNTNNGNGQISTTFDIVNRNGNLNDPTLVIEW